MADERTDLSRLEDAFSGDKDLLLFFLAWVKNGLNAKNAYLELHPGVGDHSAETPGSRMLRKVEPAVIAEAYGLGADKYFQQLKDGLEAEKRDQFSGEKSPDHKTRRSYHGVLGKMLGLEKDGPRVVVPTQNNSFQTTININKLPKDKQQLIKQRMEEASRDPAVRIDRFPSTVDPKHELYHLPFHLHLFSVV